MSLRLTNTRSRSASDILEETTSYKKSYFTESRYRTYTLKGFEEEKKSFAEQERCTPKSTQNLVKKLIASLEKKNQACKADDEFFAKYYTRNDCSNVNNCQEANVKIESKIPVLAKSVTNSNNYDINETPLGSLNRNDQRSYYNRYHTFQSESNVRKNEEKQYGFSSFDRNRYRAEPNQVEIIGKGKKEENTERKIKFVRSKSFKHFFRSLLKWPRFRDKTPQRFMSYNHLIEQSKNFNSRNGQILPRSSSLQTTVLQERGKNNVPRNKERTATIHPVYGGKRNEQLLEILLKKKEDLEFFETDENAEHLVKPSAIKNLAKCFSQLPNKSLIND